MLKELRDELNRGGGRAGERQLGVGTGSPSANLVPSRGPRVPYFARRHALSSGGPSPDGVSRFTQYGE